MVTVTTVQGAQGAGLKAWWLLRVGCCEAVRGNSQWRASELNPRHGPGLGRCHTMNRAAHHRWCMAIDVKTLTTGVAPARFTNLEVVFQRVASRIEDSDEDALRDCPLSGEGDWLLVDVDHASPPPQPYLTWSARPEPSGLHGPDDGRSMAVQAVRSFGRQR